ncbi:MAG: ABC transporter ATP-binding protein [Lachnospiraceae bacterium]|nr:ABC transporter ATP-binding protein [Lachnospiraceae bacterium]
MAVKHVSFSVEKGETVGLAGESGCGKSTLSRAILGIQKKGVTGTIKHYSKRPMMVFQDPEGSLNPSKTIGFILEEPLKIKGGMTKEERKAKISEMLKLVDLSEDLLDRYPNTLSGGQCQRVCIAAALMQEPALLIADEPVSALDVTVQSQILKLFEKIKKELKLSVIFISHDLRVIYSLCDRVMIMKDGEIVEQGDRDKLYFDPEHEYTKQLMEAAKTKYVKND